MHSIVKSSQTDLRRLADIHLRQAIHHRKPRNRYVFASPGGIGFHRQAIPRDSPETPNFNMSRLAAKCSPPGSFWKISRNQKTQNLNKNIITNNKIGDQLP